MNNAIRVKRLEKKLFLRRVIRINEKYLKYIDS